MKMAAYTLIGSIAILPTRFSFRREGHFNAYFLYIGTHRRILFRQVDGDCLHLRKRCAQCRSDASAHVFEQSGGDGHLMLDDFMYSGVAHGVGKVICDGGPLQGLCESYVNGEETPHRLLLWHDTMISMEAQAFHAYFRM